jgi:hypothetical protein
LSEMDCRFFVRRGGRCGFRWGQKHFLGRCLSECLRMVYRKSRG